MGPRKLDIHIQKNVIGPLSNTIVNKLKKKNSQWIKDLIRPKTIKLLEEKSKSFTVLD